MSVHAASGSAVISECGLYRTRLDRECCPAYEGSLVYVCLTCIDKRLGELLSEDSARHVEKDWDGCCEVADLPAVHEALAVFSADSTGDAGVAVVQAVIAALELRKVVE